MQKPTLTRVRIRNVYDANRMMHAVRLGILPMVMRRLDDNERLQLCSGCVYVWEERSNNPLEITGQEIQRFTEGRCWGPSRAREDFLLYYEKNDSNRSSIGQRNGAQANQQLIKQTYSVYVDSPRNTRKWHLNAYYTQETVNDLFSVDDFPALRHLEVPAGRYICARSNALKRTAKAVSRRVTQQEAGAREAMEDIQYNSISASGSSSSSHSGPSQSPVPFNSDSSYSISAPASPNEQDANRRLAPLEYLQNITPKARDPVDDQILRSFRCVAEIYSSNLA